MMTPQSYNCTLYSEKYIYRDGDIDVLETFTKKILQMLCSLYILSRSTYFIVYSVGIVIGLMTLSELINASSSSSKTGA